MAEKALTEGNWKTFAKAESLDDGKVASKDSKALYEAVLEALQELRDLEKSDPTEDELLQMLEALEGVLTKQVAANAKRRDKDGKAIKDTKAVKDQLYKMLSAVDKQRKEVQAAKDKKDKEAAAKGGKDGDSDEDDDSPAVLTTKLIPLIRQLKKGELRLPAMIGSISKTAAVLISKRSISNAKRKLLNEALDAAGGVKYAKGECYYETGTLHFVMSEGKVGGLAKRVRAALLAQTGLRLKVKLRGEDGEDNDGEEEAEDTAATPAAPGAQAADAATAGATNRPAPPGGPASAEQLAFTQRLRKVRDGYDAALTAQHPESTKLRALMGFASEKAAARDFAGAGKALDMIHALLGAPASDSGGPATNATLAEWKVARDAALALLKAVAGHVAAAKHPSSAKALIEIKAVIANLPASPATIREVTEVRRYLDEDDVVADVCELAEDIRTPLLGVLDRMYRQLGA